MLPLMNDPNLLFPSTKTAMVPPAMGFPAPGTTAHQASPLPKPAPVPAGPGWFDRTRGAMTGARFGAGVGALAGALRPGEDDEGNERGVLGGALRGAVRGGAMGGIGGGVVGAHGIGQATSAVKGWGQNFRKGASLGLFGVKTDFGAKKQAVRYIECSNATPKVAEQLTECSVATPKVAEAPVVPVPSTKVGANGVTVPVLAVRR